MKFRLFVLAAGLALLAALRTPRAPKDDRHPPPPPEDVETPTVSLPEPATAFDPRPRPERGLPGDPEAFLERIERNRASREAADVEIFSLAGTLPRTLWAMVLAGRRAAAELLGRIELDEELLGEVVEFIRTTGDADLAACLVRGLRECPRNLQRAAPGLARALRSRLALGDDAELLGGLADLARFDELREVGLLGFLASYLDTRRSEEVRLQAAEGVMAWPEDGRRILQAWYSAEPSPRIRATIARRFGPEALLEVIRTEPDPDVRRFAAEAVRLRGDRRLVPLLQSLLAGESDPAAARALRESMAALATSGRRIPSRKRADR